MKTLVALSLLLLPFIAVAETEYVTLNYPEDGSTFLTGIRSDNEGAVYMTGVFTPAGQSNTDGLLYHGPLDGGGSWEVLNYPSSEGVTVTSTALYGPNTLENGDIRIAGSYKSEEYSSEYDLGLFYEGPADGSGTWTTLQPPVDENETVLFTIAHSTHGGLLVGNFDTDLKTGRAFIYDIEAETYTELTHEGAVSITAYGIWHNGGTSYTIAGGISLIGNEGLSQGYLVDYNSATHIASNWAYYTYGEAYYDYVHGDRELEIVTHFDGITGTTDGGYNLTGDWIGAGEENGLGFFATVHPNVEGGYGPAAWSPISYPNPEGEEVIVTSGNSVYEWSVIGIYVLDGAATTYGYVANLTRPYLVEGAYPAGNDWYYTWIGVAYVGQWPWVFDNQTGWFFGGVDGNTNASSWFYFTHPVLACWLWCSEDFSGWCYGQPAGQESAGWWYYDGSEANTTGYFYLFSADGETYIRGESATPAQTD